MKDEINRIEFGGGKNKEQGLEEEESFLVADSVIEGKNKINSILHQRNR